MASRGRISEVSKQRTSKSAQIVYLVTSNGDSRDPLPISIETTPLKDSEAIITIDRETMGNESRRAFILGAIRKGDCLTARLDGVAAGFATFDRAFFEQTFIWLLVVGPQHRRKGVATALIEHVESVCQTKKLFTSTNQSNLRMQNLMDKLGFVKSGRIENLDEGDDEIVYFKRMK